MCYVVVFPRDVVFSFDVMRVLRKGTGTHEKEGYGRVVVLLAWVCFFSYKNVELGVREGEPIDRFHVSTPHGAAQASRGHVLAAI